MSLPKLVLPGDINAEAQYGPWSSASEVWSTWGEDPIKATVLRAILSRRTRLDYTYFLWHLAAALGQNKVCSSFLSIGFEGSALLRCFRKGTCLFVSSIYWQAIPMSGGHPLAMLKRKTRHQQFLLLSKHLKTLELWTRLLPQRDADLCQTRHRELGLGDVDRRACSFVYIAFDSVRGSLTVLSHLVVR